MLQIPHGPLNSDTAFWVDDQLAVVFDAAHKQIKSYAWAIDEFAVRRDPGAAALVQCGSGGMSEVTSVVAEFAISLSEIRHDFSNRASTNLHAWQRRCTSTTGAILRKLDAHALAHATQRWGVGNQGSDFPIETFQHRLRAVPHDFSGRPALTAWIGAPEILRPRWEYPSATAFGSVFYREPMLVTTVMARTAGTRLA